MMMSFVGKAIVNGYVEAPIVASTTGLSFWGGVHPETGVVVDHHHPLLGISLHGKILVIPGSRGSCTGSGVLLELIMNNHGPAALVFEHEELILTLGVVVALEVFGKGIPVVRLSTPDFEAFSEEHWGRINGTCVEGIPTSPLSASDMNGIMFEAPTSRFPSEISLSAIDREILSGHFGKAAQVASQVVLRMAAIQGATELLDVTQSHIDACVYTGPATLRFAQRFAAWGAKVRIPTTLNSISIDKRLWRAQGIDPAIGEPATALADAYVEMGARPTFTCAPYQLDSAPGSGEQIMWAESNAVVYANSVLGARTAKCPDLMDLCVALTGRAPNTGCHIAENRRALVNIVVESIANPDDSLFPLLGHVVGNIAANRIPIVTGLEDFFISKDDLKVFGAAFATTASAPMFHIAGITPEATTFKDIALQCSGTSTATVTRRDLLHAWHALNSGINFHDSKVDLISLGNPHFSLSEFRQLAALCTGRVKNLAVSLIVTCSRDIYAKAYNIGIISALEEFGVQVITDTCWCMIGEPLIPVAARTVMTNSAKYAHYGEGLTGRRMRFGSLARCVDAACSGHAAFELPAWLETDWHDLR